MKQFTITNTARLKAETRANAIKKFYNTDCQSEFSQLVNAFETPPNVDNAIIVDRMELADILTSEKMDEIHGPGEWMEKAPNGDERVKPYLQDKFNSYYDRFEYLIEKCVITEMHQHLIPTIED